MHKIKDEELEVNKKVLDLLNENLDELIENAKKRLQDENIDFTRNLFKN